MMITFLGKKLFLMSIDNNNNIPVRLRYKIKNSKDKMRILTDMEDPNYKKEEMNRRNQNLKRKRYLLFYWDISKKWENAQVTFAYAAYLLMEQSIKQSNKNTRYLNGDRTNNHLSFNFIEDEPNNLILDGSSTKHKNKCCS